MKNNSRKGEKYQKPLFLYPLTFDQALSRVLAAKPEPKPPKKLSVRELPQRKGGSGHGD
jgi:hypothetical protein